MIKSILGLFCWLHNFSYKVVSFLAIKLNNGEHPKHKIINYHEFFTSNISPEDCVLDIGCGSGEVARDLSLKAKEVFAIDIEEKNILKAQKNNTAQNTTFIAGDATTYDFQKEFDAIILSNVLEHIENRVDFLKKIKKLSPKILIRVPLLTRDWLSVYKKNMGLEYRLDTTHYVEYTEELFEEEMEEAGMKIEKFYVKFGELYAILKT